MESVRTDLSQIVGVVYSWTSDDVGPEVVAEATRVLEVASAALPDVDLKLETHDFGGGAIDKYGEPLTEATLEACKSADAILMGKCPALHHNTNP